MKITWNKLFYLLDENGISIEDQNLLWDTMEALFGVSPDDKVANIEILE